MANKHMRRCSTSLAIREAHFRPTVRKPPIGMAKLKTSGNSQCWRGCREARWPGGLYVAVGNVKWHSYTGKEFHNVFKQLTCNYHATQQLPSWAFIPEKWKLYANIYSGLLVTARSWKQSWCPSTGEWLSKVQQMGSMEFHGAIKMNQLWTRTSNSLNPRQHRKPVSRGYVLCDSIHIILLK